jgi:hypothetical protein
MKLNVEMTKEEFHQVLTEALGFTGGMEIEDFFEWSGGNVSFIIKTPPAAPPVPAAQVFLRITGAFYPTFDQKPCGLREGEQVNYCACKVYTVYPERGWVDCEGRLHKVEGCEGSEARPANPPPPETKGDDDIPF